MDLLKQTAGGVGLLLADKKISSVELTADILKMTEERDEVLGCLITVDKANAMKQAQAADDLLADVGTGSLLTGVPMVVKDNISTAGIRTTCGSRMLEKYIPPYSASVYSRLQKIGAVMTGKSNLDEFAMGSTCETSALRLTRNPWDHKRVPGGSSGGSAAAVAGGLAWYALGSDTGGSIRQPAGYCGLTGLKPTYGAVSRYGLIAYASSLDQIGPMAQDAADCALVFSAAAGPDKRDSTCVQDVSGSLRAGLDKLNRDVETVLSGGSVDKISLKGLKIAVPAVWREHALQPEIADVLEKTIKKLETAGAICSECDLPLLDESIPAYYLIASAEASGNLSRYDGVQYGSRTQAADVSDLADFYSRTRAEYLGPEVKRRIMLGTFALSSGYYDAWYLKAQRVRRLIKDYYQSLLADYDYILGPITPATAPEIGTSLEDPLTMYLSDIYTVAANLTGLPALALPCGFDKNNLPIGLQLTGRAYQDADLLRTGMAWQRETDYHLRVQQIRQLGPAEGNTNLFAGGGNEKIHQSLTGVAL